ncbi:MAG: hypothetical protein HQK72_15055 [Desulfamplus sp.]|nr:hypothetical protein [Desulfamplus sp.]
MAEIPSADTAVIEFIENDSNILLIAPHAVETTPYDDIGTAELTRRIAAYLECSAVINTSYRKPIFGKPERNNGIPSLIKKCLNLNIVEQAERAISFIDKIKAVVDTAGLTYVFWIHGIADNNIEAIDGNAQCLIGYGQPDKDEEPNYTAAQEIIQKLIEKLKDNEINVLEAPNNSDYRGWKPEYMNQWCNNNTYNFNQAQSIQLEFKYTGIRATESLDSAARSIGQAIKETTQEEGMAKKSNKDVEQADKTVPAQVETEIQEAEVLTSSEETKSDDTKSSEVAGENKITGTLSTEVKGYTEDGNVGDTAQADINKNLPEIVENYVMDTIEEDAAYEAITDDQVAAMTEDDKVNVTFNKLRGIFVKHFHNAMLDAGQYIIKVFYNNDYQLAKEKKYNHTESISKLIKKLKNESQGNSPSKTWIYDAINLALDDYYFDNIENKNISSAYGNLGHSHKVNLTYAPDDKKEQLITEIIAIEAETNKKCSVVKIRELISKHKRELNPADMPISEILTIDLAAFDDNILKDLQKEIDTQYKKLQEKTKLYKAKLDEIKNHLKSKTN